MNQILSFLFIVILSLISVVNAQSTSQFATGEAQRVFDLLVGLGCIRNRMCVLHDFMPTTACNENLSVMKCDDFGRLSFLYVEFAEKCLH
jgi:hypothetical protein